METESKREIKGSFDIFNNEYKSLDGKLVHEVLSTEGWWSMEWELREHLPLRLLEREVWLLYLKCSQSAQSRASPASRLASIIIPIAPNEAPKNDRDYKEAICIPG